MKAFLAAYKNEMFKISKKKKIIVGAILSVAVVLVAAALFSGVNYLAGVSISGGGNFAISILPFMEYTLIPLFSAFICIDMFSGEFSGETIKLTLTRPVSRFKVYLSKAAAAASFVLLFLMFTMVVSGIISLFTDGFKVNISDSAAAYLVTFFPLMILCLMVMLIANFARGSASAFLLSVVIFLIFKGAEFIIPEYRSFLFTASFDWYKLFVGSYVNIGKIIRTLLVFVGYGTVLFTGGYWLFEKRGF